MIDYCIMEAQKAFEKGIKRQEGRNTQRSETNTNDILTQPKSKHMKKLIVFNYLLAIAILFGYCRCAYQFCTSDFKPSYKREIVYGVGVCTGLGAIVGYINIPDSK
jgi:hypothetical protein